MTSPPVPDPNEYLSVDQIAAELDVHPQTVQTYFRTGALPGRKVGKGWRTTRAALNAWLEGKPAPSITTPEAGLPPLETK